MSTCSDQGIYADLLSFCAGNMLPLFLSLDIQTARIELTLIYAVEDLLANVTLIRPTWMLTLYLYIYIFFYTYIPPPHTHAHVYVIYVQGESIKKIYATIYIYSFLKFFNECYYNLSKKCNLTHVFHH